MSPADWPAVRVDPVTLEVIAAPALTIEPPVSGLFHDFSTGAPGVPILGGERACPSYIDFTTASGTGASLVYAAASDVGWSGLPAWAKLTCSGAGSQSITFGANSFANRAIAGGRIYVYFPVNVVQTQLGKLIGDDGSLTRLRMNTARTISILDNAGGTPISTTTFALSAGTPYRIEWLLTYSGGQIVAQVAVFIRNNLTPEAGGTFTTAPFATTAKMAGSAEFGNTNGANLAGKFLYIGGVGCDTNAMPGPWLRQEIAQSVVSSDGLRKVEQNVNGDIVMRAVRDYHYTDGGSAIYLVQEGDEMGRWNGDGFRIGPGTAVGDMSVHTDMALRDNMIEGSNRRLSTESLNIIKDHDPPDCGWVRTEHINSPEDVAFGYVGHKATLVGDVLTIDPSDIQNVNPRIWPNGWFIPMQRRGHGINVAGADYSIGEVLGPLSVKLKDPVPTSNGSNLTWKMKIFPYPLAIEMSGLGVGGTMGQPSRMFPMAFPPIANGGSGISTNGVDAVVDISALSAPNKAFWTVGRRVLLNKDPTLANARPGRCFKIISVAGDGNSVTLDGVVPQALSNKQWHLAGSNDDGGGTKPVNFVMTETHDAQCDIVNWTPTLGQGWSTVKWQMVSDGTLWENGVSNAPTAFQILATGGAQALTGAGLIESLVQLVRSKFGFQTGQGAGGTITQGSGSGKQTGVTLNKAHGLITMNNAALAAGAVAVFTLTNSMIGAQDQVIAQVSGGTGTTPAGMYRAWAEKPAAGSVSICLKNEDSSSHSDPVTIRFTVISGTNG